MKLSDFCISQLTESLGLQHENKFFEKESTCKRFMSGIQEVLRESLPKEAIDHHLTLLSTIIMPALVRAAAQIEEFDRVPCEPEKLLVGEFLNLPPAVTAVEFMTRILERRISEKIPLMAPSLDVGIGIGNASAFIFSNRKMTIGSDPAFVHLDCARQQKQYEQYACIDMTCIPFP